MMIDKKVNEIFESSSSVPTSNGYLVCNSCKGYYKLQKDEFPEDFSRCECGNYLEHCANINEVFKHLETTDNHAHDAYTPDKVKNHDLDEYTELQKIINILRTKAIERTKLLENLSKHIITQEKLLNEIKQDKIKETKLLENLSKHVMIQEKLLNEIKQERINEIKEKKRYFEDFFEEKNPNNSINQEKLLNNIEQENEFLSHVKKRRMKTEAITDNTYPFFAKIGILTIGIAAIIILIIYILK